MSSVANMNLSQSDGAENTPNWGGEDEVRLVEACRENLPEMISTHDAAVKKIAESLPANDIYTRALMMRLGELRKDMAERERWDYAKFDAFCLHHSWPKQPDFGDEENQPRIKWLAEVLRSRLIYTVLECPFKFGPDWSSLERTGLPIPLNYASDLLNVIFVLSDDLLAWADAELKKPITDKAA